MKPLPVEIREVGRNRPGRYDPRVGFYDLRVIVPVVFESTLESLTEVDRLAGRLGHRRFKSGPESRHVKIGLGYMHRRKVRDPAEILTGGIPPGSGPTADDPHPVSGPAQEIGMMKNDLDAAKESRVF